MSSHSNSLGEKRTSSHCFLVQSDSKGVKIIHTSTQINFFLTLGLMFRYGILASSLIER